MLPCANRAEAGLDALRHSQRPAAATTLAAVKKLDGLGHLARSQVLQRPLERLVALGVRTAFVASKYLAGLARLDETKVKVASGVVGSVQDLDEAHLALVALSLSG